MNHLSEFMEDIEVILTHTKRRRHKLMTLDCIKVIGGTCPHLRYDPHNEPWCAWGKSIVRKYLLNPVAKKKQCRLIRR